VSAKHTPGPWYVSEENDFEISSEWGGIGFVHNEPAENEPMMAMARANARLIAAAPEMYESLQAHARIPARGIDKQGILRARALLAKIEGAK